MKYTPGPWIIDDSDTPILILRDAPEELLIPRTIAKVFSRCVFTDDGIVVDDAEGNAKLIAAAPFMLSALEELVSGMSSVLSDDKYFREFAVLLCQDAIAKAKGGKS